MKKSEILYEPLPIGRLGIKKDTTEVVAVKDFSCFAQMLEEYICFGTVHIIMPASFPEVKALNQMPTILKDRVKVIDDTHEIEIVNKILYNIRREFNANIDERTNFISFPKNTDKKIIESLDQVHEDVKKLALGFNHSLQVDINREKAIKSIRHLRSSVQNYTSRAVLAQIEGLLNQYQKVEFEALSLPKDEVPYELITTFDRLINDSNYLEYSDSIAQLGLPDSRQVALLKLRTLVRTIGAKNYISTGWDLIAKIIEAWTGAPIPESKEIASIVQGKSLPILLNLDNARNNAIEMWKSSHLTNTPISRDGQPIGDDNIEWIPPLGSMKLRSRDNEYTRIGTAKELLDAINKAMNTIDKPAKNKRSTTKTKKH